VKALIGILLLVSLTACGSSILKYRNVETGERAECRVENKKLIFGGLYYDPEQECDAKYPPPKWIADRN